MIKKWLNDIKEGRPLWLAECREEMQLSQDAALTTISVISEMAEHKEFSINLPKVESPEEIQLMYKFLDANRVNAAMLLGQMDDTDCSMPDPKAILNKIKAGELSTPEYSMPPEPLICGLDVSLTDIKLVLAEGSRLRRILSYDWNPAISTEADMIINPVFELAEMAANGMLLDGIAVSFPERVINNKIQDTQAKITEGIRNNKDIDCKAELLKLSNLDDSLRNLVKPGAPVKILNDGDMAAFSVYNELKQTKAGLEMINDGLIALSLNADIEFGWIKENGKLAEYPGRLSECIFRIDNDSDACFMNQNKILELAKMPLTNPKPCIDMLVNMAEGGEQNAETIFTNLGYYLGHAIREINYFMNPKTNKYFLLGRLAKSEYVFDLMCIGLQRIAPDAVVLQTDSSLANTPVMKAIAEIDSSAALEFATAVGCIYYALEA